MSQERRLFAVIPAAGLSRRMGQPKLLLPLGAKTVIARLLDVLNRPDVIERFVVLRRDDETLLAEVTSAKATAVQPEINPPDMRSSVQNALEEIQRRHAPGPDEGWMLIPADHPVLDAEVLDAMIDCWQKSDDLILVPTYQQQRGHPTFFRWELAEEVLSLPPDKGLNELLKSHADEIVEVRTDNPAVLTDLDTPEDYQELCDRWNAE
jgi:molybdenum cofactor cytidylyltransferase